MIALLLQARAVVTVTATVLPPDTTVTVLTTRPDSVRLLVIPRAPVRITVEGRTITVLY